MSIGPVFELSDDLATGLRSAVERDRIQVEHSGDRLIFRRRLSCVTGVLYKCDGRNLLWLTFPKAHAFNPLLWPFDFLLVNSIERMLSRAGARSMNGLAPNDAQS